MLAVPGRGERESNWIVGGADEAAHQGLTEQRGNDWSVAATLLMTP